MTVFFQTYLQAPGAIDVDGASMDPGWYVVRMRENLARSGEQVPSGASIGPFKTKGEAGRAARARGWKKAPDAP